MGPDIDSSSEPLSLLAIAEIRERIFTFVGLPELLRCTFGVRMIQIWGNDRDARTSDVDTLRALLNPVGGCPLGEFMTISASSSELDDSIPKISKEPVELLVGRDLPLSHECIARLRGLSLGRSSDFG